MNTFPNLEARVSAQERRQTILDARIEELSQSTATGFKQLSADMTTSMKQLSNDMTASIKHLYDDMTASFKQQVAYQALFEQHLDQRFDAIDQHFAAIDQRLDTMDAHFVSIDQRFDAMDKRIDRMEEGVTSQLTDIKMVLAQVLMRLPEKA